MYRLRESPLAGAARPQWPRGCNGRDDCAARSPTEHTAEISNCDAAHGHVSARSAHHGRSVDTVPTTTRRPTRVTDARPTATPPKASAPPTSGRAGRPAAESSSDARLVRV